MKKLRVFALILVLAMVVPMVVACQPGSDMSNAFVIATSSMPKNLNPYGGATVNRSFWNVFTNPLSIGTTIPTPTARRASAKP